MFSPLPSWKTILTLVAAVALCVIAAMGHFGSQPTRGANGSQKARHSSAAIAIPIPQSEPNVTKPLAASAALAFNANIPFFGGTIEPALPFSPGGNALNPLSKKTALDCLTAAVYYEAAGQGVTGERAVAQVVLNRVRHPAFPSTICGVVYQGSERTTGCQFTFTCDGSLRRKPAEKQWLAAQEVASEALAGYVERSVGTATHYHADFVVPYWAEGLLKLTAIGNHIFYRWPGYWGRRAAFRQAYTGEAVLLDKATRMPNPEIVDADQGSVLGNGITALSVNSIAPLLADSVPGTDLDGKPRLRADEGRGILKIDRQQESGLGNDVSGEFSLRADATRR